VAVETKAVMLQSASQLGTVKMVVHQMVSAMVEESEVGLSCSQLWHRYFVDSVAMAAQSAEAEVEGPLTLWDYAWLPLYHARSLVLASVQHIV
jgi:hypothetical protein